MTHAQSQPHGRIAGLSDRLGYTPIHSLLLGLFLLLPFVRWQILQASPTLPQYAILAVVAGLGLALLGYEAWRAGDTLTGHPIWWTIAALVAWGGLSWLWSVDPYNTLLRTYQTASIVLVAYLVAQCATPDFVRRLFAVTAVAAGLVAIVGLGQYFGFNPFHYRQSAIPASTFGNKNFAALYLDLATPAVFALVLYARHSSTRWLWALVLGLCLSFLVVSRTRGSWLGLMLGLVALIIVHWGRRERARAFWGTVKARRWPLVLAVTLPILLLLLPGSVLSPGYKTKVMVEGKVDLSVATRLSADINATKMIADHPLGGVGYGGFRQAYPRYAFSLKPTYILTEDKRLARLHDDPLQQFVELGLPGGLLSLGIFFAAVSKLWRGLRNEPDDDDRQLLRLGLFVALIASGAHACVSFPLQKPISALLFWTWIGLAFALARPGQQSTQHRTGNGRAKRMALGFAMAFGLALGAAAVPVYAPDVQASYLTKQAVKGMVDRRCTEARRDADKAWALFPYDNRTRAYYLRVYAACRFSARDTLRVMDQVLAYDPTNIRALLTRGYVYLFLGRTHAAATDFEEVVQLIPHRASGYIGLGRTAAQRGNRALAETFFRQAREAQPGDPLAAMYLQRLRQMGQTTSN
ncbi:MAG TPA: O-antigen ligase family protein [Gammaproteobacteria bacterium]|nr:O-antigen ligase family protein [Gammaproteobacteria bacterium]